MYLCYIYILYRPTFVFIVKGYLQPHCLPENINYYWPLQLRNTAFMF